MLISLGLVGFTYALVEAGGRGLGDPAVAAVGAAACLLLATVANYLAIGAMFFCLSLQLQDVLGYSALAAGAASFPATVIMLLCSPQVGALGDWIGPRFPMTVGSVVLAAGMVLLRGSNTDTTTSEWSCQG